jgi:chitooligosaccharide deacetylase
VRHVGFAAVATTRSAVALTFDDGPDPAFTPLVLDHLAAAGATATFFVVGTRLREHPELVRRMVAEGHEVANHTLSHQRLDRLDRVAVRAELEGGAAAIQALGLGPAARPRLVRAPYGFEGEASRAEMLDGGWEVARWRGCLEHFLSHHGPEVAASRLARQALRGDVLLAHDGGGLDRTTTVAALPTLLSALAQRGLAIGSIGVLERG